MHYEKCTHLICRVKFGLKLLLPGGELSVTLCQLVQRLKSGAVITEEHFTPPFRSYVPADTLHVA